MAGTSDASNPAQGQEQSKSWLRTGADWWNSLKSNETAAWIMDKVTGNAEALAAAVEPYSPTASTVIGYLPTLTAAAEHDHRRGRASGGHGK
jgi:hypothetical protein